MPKASLRFIKLGGSLLDLEGLAGSLRRWLSSQAPADNVLLVGGGPFVNYLRQADRRHGLGEEASHWLAIHAMDLNSRLLCVMMPEAELVDQLPYNTALVAGRLRILLPFGMVQRLDARPDVPPLAHHWHVTSDSIAAWMAGIVGADELVLLKSRLPRAPDGVEDDLVDPYFRAYAGRIPMIRCVNLRDAALAEERL